MYDNKKSTRSKKKMITSHDETKYIKQSKEFEDSKKEFKNIVFKVSIMNY